MHTPSALTLMEQNIKPLRSISHIIKQIQLIIIGRNMEKKLPMVASLGILRQPKGMDITALK